MDIQHSICMGQLKKKQAQLKQDMELAQAKLDSTNSRIENQIQENNSLRTTISAQSANCHALESDNRALKLMSEVHPTATFISHLIHNLVSCPTAC
jgi:small-conductance mechanosensitive channel